MKKIYNQCFVVYILIIIIFFTYCPMQENYFRTDEQVHVISQWWGHRSRSNEEREKNKHTSVMYKPNVLVFRWSLFLYFSFQRELVCWDLFSKDCIGVEIISQNCYSISQWINEISSWLNRLGSILDWEFFSQNNVQMSKQLVSCLHQTWISID